MSRSGFGHALEQPCSAHGRKGCSIYERRPSACRRFDCLLVKALREGELSRKEALDLVAQVRRSSEPAGLLRLYFHRPAR